MTISFHASLLSDFTIIFAAAPPHGKTNLHTTFSFSRWAKPPNETNKLWANHSNETNKLWVRSSIIGRFHSTSYCAHFQFSSILWLRTVLFKYSKKIIRKLKEVSQVGFFFPVSLIVGSSASVVYGIRQVAYFCVFL